MLAMFLVTIFNELKIAINPSKFATICDNHVVFFYNLLTQILEWQGILYHIGINIEGPNHFWHCGPRLSET